jgi:aminoglycoside 6'-N-acetyltransferase I
MRLALWPEYSAEEHCAEMETELADPDWAVFVLARQQSGLGGFVEAGIRKYAEGCGTSPVGYIEGWYVDPDVRRKGLGKDLVKAAEDWARVRGCSEMASDCLLENLTSFRAHLALGYEEVERLIHFRKDL